MTQTWSGAAAAAFILAAGVLASGPGGPARGQETAPAAKPPDQQLAGNTLAAVIFLPHDAPRGGGSLDRMVVQAFLRQDGSALVRRWDAGRDAYTVPGEGQWTLADNTLCLDAPALGPGPRLCFEVHMWGTRIAGNTTQGGRFAMIDGDIEAGNSIVAAR